MYKILINPKLSLVTAKLNSRSTVYHHVFTNSIWVGIGKSTLALVSLITASIVTRLLTPTEAGEFFLYTNFIAILVTIASLGFPRTIVRFIAQKPIHARQIILFSFLACTVAAIVVVGITYLFFAYFPQFYPEFLDAISKVDVGLVVIFITFIMIAEEYFRGRQDLRLSAFTEALFRIFFVLFLSMMFLGASFHSLSSMAEKYTTAAFLAAAIWVSIIYFSIKNNDTVAANETGVLWAYFGTATVLWLNQCLLTILEQANYWLLHSMSNAENVALYGYTFRLILFVQLPLGLANTVLAPLAAKYHAQGQIKELERVLRTIATFLGVPSLLALLGFIAFRENILSFLYGSFYTSASNALLFLGLGQIVNVWSGSCGLTLVMCGHQRYTLLATVVSGLLSILLAYALIDNYGITGIAFANFVGLTVQNLLFLWFTRYKVGIWTHFDFATLFTLKDRLRRLT